ncbi:MAG: magnesium-translocating P-type ATPase [Micrococcales bacterium 73-13]|nr:MAG: magnesium-translocating P-type ATPase [Micrococcales bacterium 73-13]
MAPRRPRRTPAWRDLLAQFSSPIILILVAATVLAMALGDLLDGVIILVIVLASGLLGFWQSRRAGDAVARLMSQVEVLVAIVRDGAALRVSVDEVRVGDIVLLSAGGVVPADARLLEAASLLVDESALTGESFPVEKDPAAVSAPGAPVSQRRDRVFLGTHVLSGSGRALVEAVGAGTLYGGVSRSLASRVRPTSFEAGTTRFGLLLVWVMVVVTAFVFVVNVVLGREFVEALLFSLALAVGITPQMLPAILAVSLASGARRMARRKVVVKRLDAIEDLGALTIVCTDKTGTLTAGAARLDRALDAAGAESDRVLALAALNAGLQRGFPNPLDEAVLARRRPPDGARASGEVPYDFARRMLSVACEVDGAPALVTKGAFDPVLAACATIAGPEGERPIEDGRAALRARFEALSAQGYRVLGVATRPLPAGSGSGPGPEAETGLRFEGMLAFHDPAKDGVPEAIEQLRALGIDVAMITGDNRLAAAAIASSVGIPAGDVVIGSEIAGLADTALAVRVAQARVFAEVEPAHKARIVSALRRSGQSVGYLGDGINDSPALHAADVGISVDTAVDVAREAAAVVLLDKSLAVVADGVRLGRQTFANTLKYIRVTVSASFGNMVSMAAASLFLPFLPLLPRQLLVLNFLTDIPAMSVAGDRVDDELTARPGRWEVRSIARFMVVFGLVSSVFDGVAFAILALGFHAGDALFRSGWFVESTLSELVALLSLRSALPIWRTRPGTGMLVASGVVAAVVLAILYTPLADPLGLVAVPGPVLAAMIGVTALYLVANEAMKRRFIVRR